LYAHVLEESVGPVNLLGLSGKVRAARVLADGSEVFLSRPWNTAHFPNDAFFNFAKPESYTYPLPDDRDTVIEIVLSEA
jgi:alpha-L-fucosidase